MAELPDIDTSSASFIAYWNAIDQGEIAEADLAPETVTSYGGIEQYTLYDNGIQGTLSGVTREPCTTYFRVKSDGWIVVWTDRERSFGASTGSTPDQWGPWQLIEWGPTAPEQNRLASEIDSLHSNLETTGTFQYADAGLYNYEFTDATTFSVFGSAGTFTYTEGTNIHWATIRGTAQKSGYGYAPGDYDFEGANGTVEIANGGGESGSDGYGSRDLLANGDIPDPATEYTATAGHASGAVTILWS